MWALPRGGAHKCQRQPAPIITAPVRNLLVVPSGDRAELSAIENDDDVNDEGEEKDEVDGDGREPHQNVESVEELNDCKKYRGREGSTSSVQFTGGQSEDRPVYSRGLIYISAICTYVAQSTSQQVRNR
jgi:hypothetical protein